MWVTAAAWESVCHPKLSNHKRQLFRTWYYCSRGCVKMSPVTQFYHIRYCDLRFFRFLSLPPSWSSHFSEDWTRNNSRVSNHDYDSLVARLNKSLTWSWSGTCGRRHRRRVGSSQAQQRRHAAASLGSSARHVAAVSRSLAFALRARHKLVGLVDHHALRTMQRQVVRLNDCCLIALNQSLSHLK